ncbi:MAG: ATP-binding protein [Chlorobiaceae bacterium]|nr:ATP-binding protein [Chlorobiaceae bacterium]
MKCFEIELSGRYSQYNVLYDFIKSIAEREGYTLSFIDELQLSMKEAFVNAVKHGNRERDDLTVSCTFHLTAHLLQVSIRDCGKGFDPYSLPNPTDSSYLFHPTGRGVHIIRSIAEIIALESDTDGSTLLLHYIPY